MHRLANFDVSRQFLSAWSKFAAQMIFGILCGAAMIGLRTLYDLWAPTSGPFAMIYPTVLLATLYGHWRAGLAAFVSRLPGRGISCSRPLNPFCSRIPPILRGFC